MKTRNSVRARNGGLTALLAVTALAAVLIGCGGGGSDGGTSSTATATATTSTATTSTATTSTATTSTATTSTATTSTATTSTATTSTATTSGEWPPNRIFYTQIDPDSFEVRSMNPDGTNDLLFASLPATFAAVTINPAVANQVVFAHQADFESPIGIYRNSSASMTGATQLVAPSYDSVSSLQVSSDGAFVYFVADARTSTGRLMKVSINGGTPVQLDTAEAAHVSPDGDDVVYAKAATNNRAVLFRRATTTSGVPVQLTEDTHNSTFPQWSKDGTRIVFSRDSDSEFTYDLWTMAAGGGSEQRLTNTPEVDELGASFNSDASRVSFVALAFNTEASGIYRTLTNGVNSGRLLLKAVTNPGDTTYWTSSSGRSRSALGIMLERIRRRASR